MTNMKLKIYLFWIEDTLFEKLGGPLKMAYARVNMGKLEVSVSFHLFQINRHIKIYAFLSESGTSVRSYSLTIDIVHKV